MHLGYKVTLLVVLAFCTSAESRKLQHRNLKDGGAPAGKFPYVVAIFDRDGNYICTGTVLTKQWILTALTCFYVALPVSVLAGSPSLTGPGVNASVVNWSCYYAQGDPLPETKDICLLRLGEALPLGGTVQQVTVPPPEWPLQLGDEGLVASWGFQTPDGARSVSDALQVSYNYTLVGPQQCQVADILSVCAQPPASQTVCTGDLGSPLLKDWVQVGIGHNLTDCRAATFTRLTTYVMWMVRELGAEAHQIKFPVP